MSTAGARPLPRLVALDLDGTLLNARKELTGRTIAAVRAMAARGVLCVVASGRMFRDCTAPHLARLGLQAPVICYNGAVILDADGRPMSEKPVPPELCRPVIEFAAETGRTLNLYSGDRLYTRAESDWTRLYAGRTGARYVCRDDLYEWFDGRASTKLLLLDEPPVIESLLPVWRERMAGRLYVTISDPEYLEFMNPEATKGWALHSLCGMLAIDLAATAAFGDARNDLPLLEAAGYAVAMANARPELLAAADEVAGDHDADGVAEVLERWLRDGAILPPAGA